MQTTPLKFGHKNVKNLNDKKSDQDLHEEFVTYGGNAKMWIRKCVLLLPEIDRRKIWKKKRFLSIYEYAAKLAGMSRHTVDDALRILRKIEQYKKLQEVVAERGIHAVRPVLGIVRQETENFWAVKSKEMAKHALETYVKEFKKISSIANETQTILTCNARPGTESSPVKQNTQIDKYNVENFRIEVPSNRKVVSMELEGEIVEQLEKLKGKGDWNTLMEELLKIREELLLKEKPAPIENATRHIPVKIKRYILAKTHENCAFPGCNKPYSILHHTKRYALEKTHDPETLVPLCKGHERLMHHGLIENEEKNPQEWRIRKFGYKDLNSTKNLREIKLEGKRRNEFPLMPLRTCVMSENPNTAKKPNEAKLREFLNEAKRNIDRKVLNFYMPKTCPAPL